MDDFEFSNFFLQASGVWVSEEKETMKMLYQSERQDLRRLY